jgi:hypothetical protein
MAAKIAEIEATELDIYNRWFGSHEKGPSPPVDAPPAAGPSPTVERAPAPPLIFQATECTVSPSGEASAREATPALHEAPRMQDAVVASTVEAVMRERALFLEFRDASDAVLAAAGGATDDSGVPEFDPMAVVEAVTDAVIDDVIEDHVDELLHVCDHYVDVMFAEEFAPLEE